MFYNLLRKIDVDQLAACLSRWLSLHSGTLPAALALDGKFIRDQVGVVCLVDHETGVPRAMIKASQKKGEGRDCELRAAQRLIESIPDLSNTVVTSDALHHQHRTVRGIVERGGAFISQAKDNQKNVHKRAQKLTDSLSPLLPASKKPTDE